MADFYNTNQTPANGSLAMYSLVAVMLSGGWIQAGSGDATTFSNSGSGPVTNGGTGASGLGNNASWVRLQMPVLTFASTQAKREVLIQRGNSDTNWWVRYSCSGSFVGTGSGAISATVAPTALDSINVWGSAQAGTQLFDSNTIYRSNAMAQGAAPYGFYLVCFSLGASLITSNCRSILMLDPIFQASPSDPDPYVTYADTAGGIVFNTHSAGSGRFYQDGSANFLGCYSTVTSSTNYKNCNTAIYNPGFMNSIVTTVDPFTNLDITLPILYCRRSGLGAPSGPKGYSTIMSYVPLRRSTGTLLSVSSSNDRFCIGDICLPWNGTYPVLV